MASRCPSARAGNLRGGEMSMNDQPSSIYKHSLKLERRTASLYVQNTGCQQCPPSYGWGPGVRNHFLLHHVLGGKGVYVCRDRRYELSAGDTFLIYPDTTIHYCADAAEPWEYVWVGFGGLDAKGYVDRTDFSPEEPVFRGRDSEILRGRMEAVYSSFGTAPWEVTRSFHSGLGVSFTPISRDSLAGGGRGGGWVTCCESPSGAYSSAEGRACTLLTLCHSSLAAPSSPAAL